MDAQELTHAQIARRMGAMAVTWITFDPISTQNGNPNDAVDPDNEGMEINATLPFFAVYTVDPPPATEVSFRIWYKWHGRDGWHHMLDAEEVTSIPATEEMKVRAVDRVYFERLDANAGDCVFAIGPLS